MERQAQGVRWYDRAYDRLKRAARVFGVFALAASPAAGALAFALNESAAAALWAAGSVALFSLGALLLALAGDLETL